MLYLKGKPVAFWTGWTYRRIFCSSATGYDPAYAEHGIGTYLLIRMVEDFCRDDSVDVVDFGPGDASYKEQFGNDAWLERDVYIFPRTARGVVRSVARTGIGTAERGAKKLLEQTGFATRVRRKLRART